MDQGRARVRSGATTASVGRSWSRSSSRLRQSRTSAAPRRSCRPSRRSSNGAAAARVAVVGGSDRPSASGGAERADHETLEPSRCLRVDELAANRAEQRLRDGRACVPAAVRGGASPRGRAADRPRTRRRNSEWSSSSASTQRSFSAAATDSDRIVTTPSRDCQARATAPQQRAVTSPSRTVRVASPASRAESSSEYGPRGRTAISTMSASLLPRVDTAGRASCGGPRRDLPSARWRGPSLHSTS